MINDCWIRPEQKHLKSKLNAAIKEQKTGKSRRKNIYIKFRNRDVKANSYVDDNHEERRNGKYY